MKPQIIVPEIKGHHNTNPDTLNRMDKSKSYKNLSTIIICPTRGMLHFQVVQALMGLMRPMNQKVFGPIFAVHMEVGHAYNEMIKMIIDHPELSKFKYILTIEDDNLPPPDGLLKLYEGIEQYDVVGGLYWTKGEGGMPMIYGSPKEFPKNFIPQMPIPNTLQEANGLGQGFNLFRMEIFKKMPYPWFKTIQEFTPGVGARMYTQDLYFYEQAGMKGFRFAADTRIAVGHLDVESGMIW